jgi:hypothetical protein
MATISDPVVVDEIIAANGEGDEILIVRIVQYNNQFDGKIAYGLIYEGEDPLRYHKALSCKNPKTIWNRS